MIDKNDRKPRYWSTNINMQHTSCLLSQHHCLFVLGFHTRISAAIWWDLSLGRTATEQVDWCRCWLRSPFNLLQQCCECAWTWMIEMSSNVYACFQLSHLALNMCWPLDKLLTTCRGIGRLQDTHPARFPTPRPHAKHDWHRSAWVACFIQRTAADSRQAHLCSSHMTLY